MVPALDNTLDPRYVVACRRLATAVLESWIKSGEEIGGEDWAFWCDAAGILNPDEFAAKVKQLGQAPRHAGGRPNLTGRQWEDKTAKFRAIGQAA